MIERIIYDENVVENVIFHIFIDIANNRKNYSFLLIFTFFTTKKNILIIVKIDRK